MTQDVEVPIPDLRAPAPNFSVREFARTAVGSHRANIDLAAFDDAPLDAETLRVLTYLRGIERATMNHLRDVLVTPSHKDARVTAFLTTWAFEKFWIADALSAVLDRHAGFVVGAQSVKDRIAGGIRSTIDRFAPIRESIVANAIGTDVIAVHMLTGTMDTWLSQAAYTRIEGSVQHPELTALLERIRAIKDRHLEFFLPQAAFRLEESVPARTLALRRLARTALPTGSREQPASETRFFFTHLFGGAQHVLDEIDARVTALPGLEGTTFLRSRFEAVA
jgi:hypothetical protein